MEFKSETTHLGLKRTVTEESRVNIQERISLARRTLYSLIKTGVHGTNGLNARTSCKIYQVYVIPRLLYGLETIHLQNRDISELCSFHLSTLKQIQSLPNRTATSAVYLLLGVLPITAELHKRQLSLFHAIATSENNSMREIAWRQHSIGRPNSFFVKIVDILSIYKLPTFGQIMNGHYKKLDWKILVRNSVNSYWNVKLKQECKEKTTLSFLATEQLAIGKTHNVWNTVSNSVTDVRKAVTKARMATGTYLLQVHKVKFNQAEVDTTCPICQTEDEDLIHVLTSCSAYRDIRMSKFQKIKEYVISEIGKNIWSSCFNNKRNITQLIVDCQSFIQSKIIPDKKEVLASIEIMTRDYCHTIHLKRLQILGAL